MKLPIEYLWLIPILPLVAAALSAVAKQSHRRFAAGLSIGSMAISLILSCFAFAGTLSRSSGSANFHEFKNFDWFQLGKTSFQIGWVLDPLSAVMLTMVTFVGLLIFIYSVGYMAHDEKFTRFFCFLSLFAAAMLGVVIANNLLLLFMCWELVGLASYLLIGFWYQKPSAAAAAKKAFITTRIGDVLFFLGILWLYSESGTLLFYDQAGQGCLQNPLSDMQTRVSVAGLAVTTAIGLLIFCGAIGKSGQVPLHVWLPDAMEGPTPVSALIHAATMVAAGVFLVARVYPLMAANAGEVGNWAPGIHISALTVVAWVGAITALFAASIAVAQTDIKRILAYSTVSQLGFMMLGLGVGGVAVGIFHLITHAFFKALLFLGAGSVIHGCHEEQDIRRMGGLKKYMPVTFATYAIGMMALSGVPLVFSGFWSKDAILEKAHEWSGSHWPASGSVLGVLFTPFHLGVFAALLTAFYMTRQMCYVFFGSYRGSKQAQSHGEEAHAHSAEPHESPNVMTWPLRILAAFAILLGFLGTPVWPWFQSYLNGVPSEFEFGKLFEGPVLFTLTLSTFLVIGGVMLGWWLYGQKPIQSADELDPLERVRPEIFGLLRRKFSIDEIYEMTVIRFNAWWAQVCDGLDFWLWNGLVHAVAYVVVGLAWIDQVFDQFVINLGFDEGCKGAGQGGKLLSRLQNGRIQDYLRVIGVALAVLVLVMIWGVFGAMNGFPIISVLTFAPLVAALVLIGLGPDQKRLARGIALGASLLNLVLAAGLWMHFDPASHDPQFVKQYRWISTVENPDFVQYYVGVDGLSMLMVLLTALVVPIAILASWKIEDKVPTFFSLVLFLQSGLFGTFTALNFVHWFIFWEISLVPAFFLIKLWGGTHRSAAATQFFIYTMVGSVAMLLSFLALYYVTGTFDFLLLADKARSGSISSQMIVKIGAWQFLNRDQLPLVIFAGVFLGFAVKVPVVPFHTWLPTTYSEAPTSVTMLLTGLMSKMGVYGFLRILLPIFPDQMRMVLTPLLWLAVATIVLPACAAFAQKDLKRMFAYSSINHLGYCLLGIFALAKLTRADGSSDLERSAVLNGVMLQMFNHGLTAPILFCFIAFLENRSGGLRGVDDFGGLRKAAPVFCGLMGIAIFASLGLPGLNGFIGEFLIFKGSFALATWATALSVLGLLVTAVFLLTMVQRVFNGPLNGKWSSLPDLNLKERLLVAPALALMLLIGVCPQFLIGKINSTVIAMVENMKF